MLKTRFCKYDIDLSGSPAVAASGTTILPSNPPADILCSALIIKLLLSRAMSSRCCLRHVLGGKEMN